MSQSVVERLDEAAREPATTSAAVRVEDSSACFDTWPVFMPGAPLFDALAASPVLMSADALFPAGLPALVA